MVKNKLPPVFILAGGFGTRLSEETNLKPKPMVEIGGIPILLHIMRFYYSFGFDDFVICAGYKSWDIKRFFMDYEFQCSNLEIDHRNSLVSPPKAFSQNVPREKWRVRVIDTGEKAMTGARVARAFDAIDGTEPITDFALTYGDGLTDVDLQKEYRFHLEHSKAATVLAVRPIARFGDLAINKDSLVPHFVEKPEEKAGFINGGFFFFNRSFRQFLDTDDSCILERKPLESVASKSQLMAYQHMGFWQCMDTMRDKNLLEQLWSSGKAPWSRGGTNGNAL